MNALQMFRLPMKSPLAPLTCLVAVLTLSPQAAPSQDTQSSVATHELVIRNGRLLDGAGNPWIRADLAIDDGRISEIGRVEGVGTKEIDATGRFVSPGFIDMMDQSGSILLSHGLATNKLRMGVTSAIGGEGGTPYGPGRVGEFFSTLEQRGISINFGSYFSATQARVALLGSEARAPEPAELEQMRDIVRQAMRDGALGLTTALIYPPSSYATTEELIELSKAIAPYGGLYASHIRGEGKELVEAVQEAIEIGEKGGVGVEIFHLKAAYQPGWGTLMQSAARVIDQARQRGVDVAANLYPYTAGGTGLEATIPSWAHDGGIGALRQRLLDPEIRQRLKAEVEGGSPGWWNIVEAAGGWQNIVLVNARSEQNARFEGSTLAEIATATGKEPTDAAWDLVLEGQGRVMAIYFMMSDDDIQFALEQPWVSIGSDAGASAGNNEVDLLGLPHPRSYGTFPRILSRYVRELGVLTLEEAVRRMTSWPATRMGLADRGVLREGLWADVIIFDPETVEDRATYDEPTLYPTGIDVVIVNGVVVIENGEHTGATPGRVLYGPGRDRR